MRFKLVQNSEYKIYDFSDEDVVKQSDCPLQHHRLVILNVQLLRGEYPPVEHTGAGSFSWLGSLYPTVNKSDYKQLCKSVSFFSRGFGKKKKKKTNKNEVMCCVVFRGPVLYKQKIIYHMTTNKTNIWLWAILQVSQSVAFPPVLWMSKPREFQWLHSSRYRCIFRPFSFDSTKQLREEEEEEEEEYGGDRGGPGLMNTSSGLFVHVSSLLFILQKIEMI